MTSEKRNPTRFRFSKTRIDTLPIPLAGRAEYRDLATPGLVLRRSPPTVPSRFAYSGG